MSNLDDIQKQISDLKKQEKELIEASKEKFSVKKAVSGFNLLDPVGWVKWLSGTFRTLIIVGLCFGLVFGYGYVKGGSNKPVNVGYKDFTAQVSAKDGTLHKVQVKNGVLYFDGQIVKAKDVDKLSAYGIKIRPKAFVGLGSTIDPEAGLGFQLLKFKKFNFDVFGTQRAIYAGISYDLDFKGTAGTWIQNSSIGIGAGKSWDSLFGKEKEDIRAIVYWSIRF